LKPILRNTTSFSALTLLVGSSDPQKPSPKWPIVFSGTLNPTHFTSVYCIQSNSFMFIISIITHRRSIAERGGRFVNTITSEPLNVGQWNLTVRCNVQKYRQSSKVRGQGHSGQKQKCGILFGSRPLGRGPRAAFYREWFLGAQFCSCVVRHFYAGGKISACCQVYININYILQDVIVVNSYN